MLFGMYGTVSDLISIDLANALLFTAFALTWTGARVFDHRRPLPILLFGGAALWLVLCRVPSIAASWDIRVLLCSGIITAYIWATAYEFWRGRSEPLVSRWPAIFMLFAHGALYLLRTPLGAMLPWSPDGNRCFRASGSLCSASRRCCLRSRSPSSCWRWPRNAPNIATGPPR